MDPLIEQYLLETFHPDLADEIKRSFDILNDFNFPDVELDFIALLMQSENMATESVQDYFIDLIYEKLNAVLQEHQVVLAAECTLMQKNSFLEALYTIQRLIDYSGVLHILEADLPDDEKLVEIFSQVGSLSADTLSTMLVSFNPSLLTSLKAFIHNKLGDKAEEVTPYTARQREIILNLRKLKSFLQDKPALGLTLLQDGVLLDQELELYLPYTTEVLEQRDVGQLALDILSLLLLSKEGSLNPLVTFRSVSARLIPDLSLITKVDVALNNWLTQFEGFKQANTPGSVTSSGKLFNE